MVNGFEKHLYFRWLLLAVVVFSSLSTSLFPSTALGWIPQQYPTQSLQQAVGVVAVQPPLTLYAEPSTTAATVEAFTWQRQSVTSAENATVFSEVSQQPVSANQLFLAFYPKYQLALLTVLDETPDGWLEVALPSTEAGKAWLAPNPQNTVYVWQEFIRGYAKNFGFQWLAGVPAYQRSVRLKPEDTAPLVPVTIVQGIKVLHVRGNWMLVELRDMGAEHPIGWLRWRDEEGNLMVWPNFSGHTNAFQAPSNPPDMTRLFDKEM
jgi:hypothetical protein